MMEDDRDLGHTHITVGQGKQNDEMMPQLDVHADILKSLAVAVLEMNLFWNISLSNINSKRHNQ